MPTRNSTHAVFRAVDGSMSAQSLHISAISSSLHFGDFGVSIAATVAGRYTRWGGPRLSVRGFKADSLSLVVIGLDP